MLVIVSMVIVGTSSVGCRRSRSDRLRRSVRSARDGEVLADDVGDGLLVAGDDLRLQEMKTVIERGIARGDLRPDTDVRIAHELLLGPLYYRLLFSGAPLDNRHANAIVGAMMRAFAPVD
jgi:tetracycline repressor-like protein